MSQDTVSQNAVCETVGCSENGKIIVVDIPTGAYLLCGQCSNQITNLSIIN